MVQSEFRSGSLRGEVGLKWEAIGRPNWNLDQTIREVVLADQTLERGGTNPAPTLRRHRLRADHENVDKWVRGCKFPWLNPRQSKRRVSGGRALGLVSRQ
jgi:hypothetical protein